MLEASDFRTERVERVIFLALRYVADRIGLAGAQTLEFATRLVLKAEVASWAGLDLSRHPAFLELGGRLKGAGSDAADWDEALRTAALAEFGFPASIEFEWTQDKGMVLRTRAESPGSEGSMERQLSQLLIHPDPWLEQLLPRDFLRQLVWAASPSAGPAPGASPETPLPQPQGRFLGVPFLKGLGQEVTSIELCPAAHHLVSIRDGSELEVANRLTLKVLDLGELANARMFAFRPPQAGDPAIELAIVGPPERSEIARIDLKDESPLPGLALKGATAIQYSGNGRFLAAGNGDGRVKVWHFGLTGPAQVLESHLDARVDSLVFHPDNHTLYAILASGALGEIALAPTFGPSMRTALREKAPGLRFKQVSAAIHGDFIYLSGHDDHVYVVDTAVGDVGVITPGVGAITRIQILPVSGHLCVLGHHAVYRAHPVGPGQMKHQALHCTFDASIYAACELNREVLLVFHAL